MSKHIFTPNGNTPMFVNAADGALKFIFPAPELFTLPNDAILRIDDDAPCGVWDLDSAQTFPGEVPHDLAVRELGRITSSILIFAEHNPAFPDDFFNLNRITRELLDAYSAAAKTAPPSLSEVMDAARTRWLDKRKLRFDYGGQTS